MSTVSDEQPALYLEAQPWLNADYDIVEASSDDDGWDRVEVVFSPGIDAATLMWKLATRLFGPGRWLVIEEGVERDVEHGFYFGELPRISAWRKRFVVRRTDS